VLAGAQVAASDAAGEQHLLLGGEQRAAPYLPEIGLEVLVDSDGVAPETGDFLRTAG
jgi:hypothetical protein